MLICRPKKKGTCDKSSLIKQGSGSTEPAKQQTMQI